MSRRAFLTAFFLVLALRLAALPLPGTEDVGVWRVWSFAASKDVLGVYGVGGSPPERPSTGACCWRWPTWPCSCGTAAYWRAKRDAREAPGAGGAGRTTRA